MLVLCIIASFAGSIDAATRKKPVAKKPVVKKPVSTHHETTGTSQLQGEFGLIGHTYTLGKVNPWNISLKSAEYTTEILRTRDSAIAPDRNSKLLVLHFVLHNPQKNMALMRHDTIRFTAVDANDKNWEGGGGLNNETTKENVNQLFKPAQKMEAYTIIVVPAAGEIPKIMLMSGDKKVIRYDVRGKVKPLSGPVADPNDQTGATALANVPAKIGDFYPASMYNLCLEKVGFSDGPIDGKTAKPGERFLVANFAVKFLETSGTTLRFDTFAISGVDADSIPIKGGNNLLAPSSDTVVNMHVDLGQEMKFRTYLRIPKGVTPKSLIVTGNRNGRSYIYSAE